MSVWTNLPWKHKKCCNKHIAKILFHNQPSFISLNSLKRAVIWPVRKAVDVPTVDIMINTVTISIRIITEWMITMWTDQQTYISMGIHSPFCTIILNMRRFWVTSHQIANACEKLMWREVYCEVLLLIAESDEMYMNCIIIDVKNWHH